MKQNIVIAKITSAFGVKGLTKLVSFTKNPADFAKYSHKIFDAKNRQFSIKIINQIPSQNNNSFIVQIEGIIDRTQAESLRDVELLVKRSDLERTKKDEFYYTDLVDLDVLDVAKGKVGRVVSVNDFGAGGVVEIKFDAPFFNFSEVENFSFTNQNFPEINLDEGFLVLSLPEIVEI